MIKNILEYLERSAALFPEKTAFSDEQGSVTYEAFTTRAKQIGTSLARLNVRNRPVAVLVDKSVACLTCLMGVVYSGNFYVVIDTAMPRNRIATILQTLSPVAILTDKKNESAARSLQFGDEIFLVEDALEREADIQRLAAIRRSAIDTDPLYALFTSGSTGVPKGAVICHRSVIDYAEWVTDTFEISSETVFGNQTPFYFSMSVLDIFSTIKNGATLHIIPKPHFSFPMQLLEYIKEKEINTIYWVPSALCIVANWKALDVVKLPGLKKVLFAGEVMPTKQLNMWISHLPHALFANLYGPTEITDICTYYVVDRPFQDDEPLPIGKACNNCDVLLLTKDGKAAAPGEEGELCVRGSFLAMGYYNNPEKTAEAFVQNPLNPYYPELIYKTGDLVKYNSRGELVYISRKDFQIKHMGYRIEIGEIETAISAAEGVRACVCVYDSEKDKIILIYQGEDVEKKDILSIAQEKLPRYMHPNKMIKVQQMPYNANGKIDRAWLKNNYKTLNK